MKRLVKFAAVCMGLGILSASLSGCSQDEKNTTTSSSIASESDNNATRFNYSQMPDGSVVIPITNEKGELIEEIEFPEQPANVCFGGKKRNILFVTARKGAYTLEMNVKGVQ